MGAEPKDGGAMDSQIGRHLQVEMVVAGMLRMRANVVLMNARMDLMSDVGEIDYVRYFRYRRAAQDYAAAVKRYRRAVEAWTNHVLNFERSSGMSQTMGRSSGDGP
jgi:hypothetical protein